MQLQAVVRSQYRAALAMLRQAVEACPEEMWNDPQDRARFWQVAYHALFYTHLYLQESESSFRPMSHSPVVTPPLLAVQA